MPVISIIVPVYNSEKFICRCIDNILAQTFTDFELILVDDGSPDNCGAICDSYTLNDDRVRVIHQDNQGVSSARNTGLDVAVGTYIMFCDSDDVVAPEWCESLLDAMYRYPSAWISCNAQKVSFDGIVMSNGFGDESGALQPITFYALYNASLSGSACNKIYRHDWISNYKLQFQEQHSIGEDAEFNMSYLALCDQILFLDKSLYFYYQNAGSAINKYKYNSFDLYRHTFFDRLPFIEEQYREDYLDNWLFRFVKMLEDAWDPRSPLGTTAKFRYCNKMMQTEEFRFCADHASGEKESPLFMKVVRTHNFYLYWIFCKVASVKKIILRKK